MEIADALDRLVVAADDGRLADLADRHGLALITVFGSAARDVRSARDLDVAVLFRPGVERASLAVLNGLTGLVASDAVDLLVLDGASPTARFSGLVGALPLYEDLPGRWGDQQMAAASEVFDTEWLRREELARMADL